MAPRCTAAAPDAGALMDRRERALKAMRGLVRIAWRSRRGAGRGRDRLRLGRGRRLGGGDLRTSSRGVRGRLRKVIEKSIVSRGCDYELQGLWR